MKVSNTIMGSMDVEVKYKNFGELIRAWFIALRFTIMQKSINLTISGKNVGSIKVIMFPKFKFSRAGE